MTRTVLYYRTTGDDGWFDIYTPGIRTKDTKKSDRQFIYQPVKSKAKGKLYK